ncbi:MAG TPA: TetR/AcrR family transcriptional regulator [Candidatus Limnocylindrales bacterium]
MPPRPIAPDRMDRILEAAAVVFARDGFAGARMEDVAATAGVSKGALYLSFDSKERLIQVLVERLVGSELRRIREAAAGDGPTIDRLIEFVSGYVEDVTAVGDLGPVVLELYARAGRAGPIRETLRRSLDAFVEGLERLIDAGVRRGELGPVDGRTLAVEIAALLEGTVLLWVLDPAAVDVARVAPEGVRHIVGGLAAQAAGSSRSGEAEA